MVKSGAVPFYLCPPRARLVNTARGRQTGRQANIIDGGIPHSTKTCFKDRPTKSLPAHPSARVDVGEASNHLKLSTSPLSSSTGARCMKLDWEIKSRHSPMTGVRRSNLASRYQFDDDQISVFYVLTAAIRIVEAPPLPRCKQLTTIQKIHGDIKLAWRFLNLAVSLSL